MEIALATDSHVPEIVEIWKEFMDFHKDIDSVFTRSEDGHVTFGKFVRGLIESDDSQVLVALDKGRVVAYSFSRIAERPPVYQDEKYGLISDMAVKSTHRRKGVGEQLLAKIYEWFESRKMNRIELRVVARNQIGYSFWKKHGFRDYVHELYLNR